ncbi:Transcriptional regulator, IclR family [hydrothermal vent metagenome]|uniref:Transcriptional regulator, IclR family n=1 Tax=hydrothermal vent metagenome TaxID=652676 RepID=A0A3B0UAP3_9ZZZZ
MIAHSTGIPPSSNKPATGQTLSSFAKGLRVFECVSDAYVPMGVIEIATKTGIEKSAVQRIINTLVQTGYFLRDTQTRKYRVGPRSLRLGYGYLATDSLVKAAMPHLFRLSDIVQCPITLAIKLDKELIIAARLRLNAVHNSSSVLGERMPFYWTASGRAILANLPEHEALEILQANESGNFTTSVISNPAEIYQQLKATRQQGYVVTEDDITKCKIKFGAPILDNHRYPVAALVICILNPMESRAALEKKIAPLLLSATTEISKSIGFQG